MTITFNDIVIHDGEISSDYSYYDYQNNWSEIMIPNKKRTLLCQTELPYSTVGLIPLSITLNSVGVLNYASTTCNYTSSTHSVIDPSIDFGRSCDLHTDNKRNIKINKDTIDIAPNGWSYHISNETEFRCDIFMDPKCSAWIPGYFARGLREARRR